jgi:hypothetical protein
MSSMAACTPEAASTALLDVSTQLTWCGGIQPPPGEPPCHTSARSTSIEISHERSVVALGTSGPDGHLLVAVPAGFELRVVAVDRPAFEQCDEPTVIAAAGTTTAIVQTCTVLAP